jgi:endonuclease YncB( thermonuclease family)
VLLTTLLTAAPLKGTTYGTAAVSQVTSIYDGDTFRANIAGWPDIVGHHIPVRVNGIDTPELRGKCQKEKDLASRAKKLTVETLRSAKKIELRTMKRGKYFRIVADVYVDGKSLGEKLIDADLAVEYHGGTKVKDWCE